MTPEQLELAACRDMPTEVFFPVADPGRGPGSYSSLTAAPKRVCTGCPVIEACRESFDSEPHGIWFGTDENERGVGRRRQVRLVEVPPARVTIGEILAGSPRRWFTASELAEWSGFSKDSVHKVMQRFVASGDVERRVPPQNRPWVYRWAA